MNFFLPGNLKVLRDRKKRSQQEIADFLEIKRGILANYEVGISNPSLENMLKISEYYRISINTLLTVDLTKLSGAQLADLERGIDIYIKGSKMRVLATTVNDDNEENVELVSIKAKAGYTAGYADPEYIAKLPRYHFPLLSKDRKYRMFQIEGDSMLPIRPRSWITCEYVENWYDIKDGQGYVIVTKDEGLVFKRVYSHIKKNKTLLLVSSNAAYKPYEVQITEVLEVWKFMLAYSEHMD